MNTWIFQGNPDYFDIGAYLDEGFQRVCGPFRRSDPAERI